MDSGSGRAGKRFRAEREFGLSVGGLLVLLGGWWLWRGKFGSMALTPLVVGAVMALLGITFPNALTYPNRGWMWLAGALSFISTRVILATVFFLIVTPIGIVKRITGWDPLHRRAARSESYWQPYSERQRDARHYEKMF